MNHTELFKQIRRIEVRMKGLVSNVFSGEYHSAFKGRGIEFAEVRPYQFGDDIRSIDWNVSARLGDTFVKVFEEEREQTLVLAVDVSGSESFGSRERLKKDLAAEICAVLAFSATHNNDKVGLLLFSDRVELFVPPKKGRRHVLRIIRELYAFEPESRKTSIGAAIDHLMHVIRRRSIIVLVSDFFDTQFERSLRALVRRHDTVAVQIIDPREEDLPPVGLITLIDAETGEAALVDAGDARVRRHFGKAARRRQEHADALFKRLRLEAIRISTDEGCIEPLIRFFRQRNRMLH